MEFLVDDPQHAYYKLSKTNLERKAKLIEYIVKVENVIAQQDKDRSIMNVESGYSDFAEDVEGERQITVETKPIPGIPNQSGTLFIGEKVIEIKEVPKISTDPSALPIINVAPEDVTDMTNDVSNESSWGTPWTGNDITAVKILNTHPSVSVMAAPMSISQNVAMVLKDMNGFEKKN